MLLTKAFVDAFRLNTNICLWNQPAGSSENKSCIGFVNIFFSNFASCALSLGLSVMKLGNTIFLGLLLASLNLSAQAVNRFDTLKKNTDERFFDSCFLSAQQNFRDTPRAATRYYLRLLSFPLRSGYTEKFTQCYRLLGELYQTFGTYDSALLMHSYALSLSKKFNFKKEEALANIGIGLDLLRLSKKDSAKFFFNQGIAIALPTNDLLTQAAVYNGVGTMLLEENDYQEAMSNYIKAANLYELAHDEPDFGWALRNIGNVQNIIGQAEKAITYTKRALALSGRYHDHYNIAYCHQLLGRIYRKQKKPDQALKEYKLAMSIYSELGNWFKMSETIHSIGNVYFDREKYNEALENYIKSLSLAKKKNSGLMVAYSFAAMAETYYRLKKYEGAVAYTDSAAWEARLIKNPYLELDAYGLKSEVFKTQKKFELALRYHEKFSALTDSITTHENRAATTELEAKYENEKKQAEIELLHKDQLLKDASLQQSRLTELILFISIILLIAVGYLIFTRSKMINQAKRQMEIEKIRNQIARDLHDDMGSTLSSINIFSQLGAKEESNPTLAKYFQRIGEHSSRMMENMADMVWSINPANDSFQKTVTKMKEFSSEILEPKNIGYRFTIDEQLHSVSLYSAKRKNLFLIFKEAINNAAKYSEGDFIEVVFQKKENELIMSVRDNGNGFDLTKNSAGNGLGNMKERAAAIGGSFHINSSQGSGVSIQVNVAIT